MQKRLKRSDGTGNESIKMKIEDIEFPEELTDARDKEMSLSLRVVEACR